MEKWYVTWASAVLVAAIFYLGASMYKEFGKDTADIWVYWILGVGAGVSALLAAFAIGKHYGGRGRD